MFYMIEVGQDYYDSGTQPHAAYFLYGGVTKGVMFLDLMISWNKIWSP